MIAGILSTGVIKVLLVLVLVAAAFIITRRNIYSLFVTYAFQSLFISFIALVLYLENLSTVLLFLAILTVLSKVIVIPFFMNKIQKQMKIKRDVEFHYLTPVGSMFISLFLVLLVYGTFSKLIKELASNNLFFLGSVIGVSLVFMGMLVIFSRKKTITKIIGYLTMENGVLLFSLFFPELPFIIEILIMLDLVMIIVLAALMAFGIDSTIEEFHKKLNSFGNLFGDEKE